MMVENNRFRRDLYYRLGVIRIRDPAPEKKIDRYPAAGRTFYQADLPAPGQPPVTMSTEVAEALLRYDWPGNIREMQNVLEGAVEMATNGRITYDLVGTSMMQTSGDMPVHMSGGATVHDLEKKMILDYLEKYKYNKTKVALALGISRRTLYRRLDQYLIAT